MKTKKSMTFVTVLTSLFMVASLASCSPENSETNGPNSGSNTQVNTSENNSENDTTKSSPKSVTLTLNKTKYLYGEQVNLANDFNVIVKFDDNSEKVANYDKNRANGWYFKTLIAPNGESLQEMPSSFLTKGEYKFTLGFSYNQREFIIKNESEIPSGKIEVLGGFYSGQKPDKLTANLTKKVFEIGEKFTKEFLVVQGIWNDYGGADDIPNDRYEFTSTEFNLNESLKQTGTYNFTISYMGVSTSASFEVVKASEVKKSKVNYSYYQYGDDNVYGSDAMPAIGEPKTLVVPVWFKNSGSFVNDNEKNNILKDIKTAYFGTKEETGWHSVQSYYWEDSYHQLKITGDIADWYNLNMNAQDVTEENTLALSSMVATNYRQFLINNNRLDEWLSFDSDNDGFLDAVIMIYAAPTQFRYNDNLWAYCFWADNEPNKINPTTNVYFWASYEFMYGDQPSGSPIKIDAHTYIHEMGHILGLDDYYDYSGKSMPAGSFSMQDANVGGHDPFSKLAYGWIEPYVPTKSTQITLGDFDSTGDLIVLCPNWDGSPFNEYLLLEYWTPTGLNELDSTYLYCNQGPKGPKATGLRVWHVDTRMHPAEGEDVLEDYVTRKSNLAEYVMTTITNTTFTNGRDPSADGYCSPFKEEHKLDELALLNRSKKNLSRAYNFNENFSKNHLFDVNDKFSINEYKMQFPNRTLLNSGLELGFEFEVLSKTSDTITINLIKK